MLVPGDADADADADAGGGDGEVIARLGEWIPASGPRIGLNKRGPAVRPLSIEKHQSDCDHPGSNPRKTKKNR